jgi:hypothetical protein
LGTLANVFVDDRGGAAFYGCLTGTGVVILDSFDGICQKAGDRSVSWRKAHPSLRAPSRALAFWLGQATGQMGNAGDTISQPPLGFFDVSAKSFSHISAEVFH